jgi:glycosyltransferase involved in cell wall biosynthesis
VWYRVLKELDWVDGKRGLKTYAVGQLVNVHNRHDAGRMLASGQIGERLYGSAAKYGKPAEPDTVTTRIGIWLKTSSSYSGGRLHMYQYAICLAQAGAEVFLITNNDPRWMRDYPRVGRLKVLDDGHDCVPPDLDIIVTDSKGDLGRKALDYKKRNPRIPFVCFNFETSNWVRQFCPDYATKLNDDSLKQVFTHADFLIANSQESGKWLLEWIGKDIPLGIVPPAVNTHSLEKQANIQMPPRTYALWSGRSPAYKGSRLAGEAIWAVDAQLDFVTMGNPIGPPRDTNQHKHLHYPAVSDAGKFQLMRDAHVVLAPSLFEGFGMVPMEALARGTQCIVYDLPVLRQNYGDRLIYVPWGDAEAFTAKVAEIVTSPKPAIPDKQHWAISTYGLDAMAERIERLPHHRQKRASVSVQLICYATPTVRWALESIYPHVDQILVAYGPTPLWQDFPDGDALQQIRDFPDPDGKILIHAQPIWTNKRTMRAWCAERAEGNYLLMLDADEIWVGLDKWIEARVAFGSPRWVNFWHSGRHWVSDSNELGGRRWGRRLDPFGSACPHYRWSWWRSSYEWRKHPLPFAGEHPLTNIQKHVVAAKEEPGCVIYHLGHCLPDGLMRKKHDFYLERDGRDVGRVNRMKMWHQWKGQTGDCGDGIVEKVDWELPDLVKGALNELGGDCNG